MPDTEGGIAETTGVDPVQRGGAYRMTDNQKIYQNEM